MKQVIILRHFHLESLQDLINIELKKWSSNNTELQFSTSHTLDNDIEFICMIIIKNVAKDKKCLESM